MLAIHWQLKSFCLVSKIAACYFKMILLALKLGRGNLFMFRCWMIRLKHFCPQIGKKGQKPLKTILPGSQCNAAGSETSLMLRHPAFGKRLCLLQVWLVSVLKTNVASGISSC